ncbi:MAG: bifunctional [glutamate--ammonia ligase]-adenylyl-L-tyrosine phosphorylase/[glutamate--ammonia-ligase] adenylyltransferase [Gammaproteobacteria bacterium]|nr:bifunctional [glutamate--ammonia ligase]-adenylyl-L-tyrosine phosphorylase/[glutamate--ammonia-ligase] adenylyltransferase [Gammaproteobacteria bacterium]
MIRYYPPIHMAILSELEKETLQRLQLWREGLERESIVLELDDELESALQKVFEASEYVSQCCQRDPGLLPRLLEANWLRCSLGPGSIADELARRLASATDETGLHQILRQFRKELMVHIIWRDICGLADLGETLENLSEMADCCVGQALDKLYGWAIERQGTPRDIDGRQQHLMVLGMGKLGARELNLSSDIDLIFIYPDAGEVDGSRPVANELFFFRLCQQLIKAINTQTADGFVFRVDTRLRPFGESGPLAVSLDAIELYYQSQGREWERYAMIKARMICGQEGDKERLLEILCPFVYRRYLDFGVFESLREMKSMISRELKRKGMADNIKLGPGGIREIEFFGQAFQLVRGGREPALRTRPILSVLRELVTLGELEAESAEELIDAYRFLRLVENRIQAWQDRQTHLLPEDEVGRLRMARAMGFEDWRAFYAVLTQHRGRVQEHFDRVFALPESEGEADEGDISEGLFAVWDEQIESDAAEVLLVDAGFENGEAALVQLMGLRHSSAVQGQGERGRSCLGQLIPALLAAVGQECDSHTTLERLLKLLEAVARRTAYLAMLVESPVALEHLVKLTASSPWVAEQITRQPILLDELLDPRRLYAPLRKEALELELRTLLETVTIEDLEQRMERLRQFAQGSMLRVAAADLDGVIPLMVVSDYLTEIAEVVTQAVLEQAWHDLTLRHGRPQGVTGEASGLAVIGYGKMGGIELGYGSDLDMVFIAGDWDAGAMTDGKKPIANDTFYTRLGRRMIHIFTTRTPAGRLYEVDMRLRPNGNSGLLVSCLNAFESYQRKDAWTWEHQALLRARPVAGDRLVIEQFQKIRREILVQPRDVDELRQAVAGMREKMRTALDKSSQDCFDIKQGRGGIADIEFMVQYSALQGAAEYPDLLDWTDNIRLLDALGRHQLLEPGVAEQMAEVYRTLRAAYHRHALRGRPGLLANDELLAERHQVEALWQRLMT